MQNYVHFTPSETVSRDIRRSRPAVYQAERFPPMERYTETLAIRCKCNYHIFYQYDTRNGGIMQTRRQSSSFANQRYFQVPIVNTLHPIRGGDLRRAPHRRHLSLTHSLTYYSLSLSDCCFCICYTKVTVSAIRP